MKSIRCLGDGYMREILLAMKNVEISYNARPYVRDISFQVKEGEILGIVGESGSGKSTLIKAAMGLLGPTGAVTKGHVYYKGENILDYNSQEFQNIRGYEMGMIFQNSESALCPVRTIGDQLYESMSQHKKITKEEAKSKGLALLDKLNFKDGNRILKSYPFELSGGMNQRVGIMMGMLLKPSLLFADEPTSALDVTIQLQVIREMMKMRDEYGTAIVIVSHNIGVISYMADTVVVMKEGNIVEYGTKDQIVFHPQEEYTKKLIEAVPRIRRENG